MSKAKSRNIISLLAIMIISLVMALCVFSSTTAYAASPDASRYFNYKHSAGNSVSGIKFENNVASLPLRATEEAAFSRALVVDDFQIVFDVPVTEVKEFSVLVPLAPYIATGNPNADGGYDTTVANEIKFVVNASDFTVTLNGMSKTVAFNSANNNYVELYVNVVDNVLVAKVNSTLIPVATSDAYKVAFTDKPISNVSFKMNELSDSVVSSNLLLKSVNTKATATDSDKYQQTFQLDASGSGFSKYARPRYVVNEGFMHERHIVIAGDEYTVSTTAYSFMGTATTNYLRSDDADVDVFGTARKNISFSKAGTYEFEIFVYEQEKDDATGQIDQVESVCETYTVTAVKEGRNGEGNAPVYNATDDALNSFKAALEKACYKNYETKEYIGLGTDRFLDLPSLNSLVSDNVSTDKNLTYTIYYKTPETSSTYSSGSKIPVPKAGKYSFYVVFKDSCGNEMKTYDFIKDESLPLDDAVNQSAPYAKYIFEFELFDNAPLEVEARPQGTAYVGIEYKATSFTFESSEGIKTYTLSYSKTGEDNTWKIIDLASKVTDEDKLYGEGTLTYDEVKSINFTGGLTFTPHATGYYKLSCLIDSSSSTKWGHADAVIEVKAPTELGQAKEASNANVPQIIFLSVGGVCFAGIIALFFVKPKQRKDED